MKKQILCCNIDFRAYEDAASAVKKELEDGLLLSALCKKAGVEKSTVQNWVKRGYLSNPDGKKYSCEQVAEVIILNNLRNAISLDEASRLVNNAKKNSGVLVTDILAVLASSLIRAKRFNSTDRESLKSVINIELRSAGIDGADAAKLILVTALSALCADYKEFALDEIKS